VLLLEDLSSVTDVSVVSAKVLDNVRKMVLMHGRELAFTPSMGGTFCKGDLTTSEALLARADHALYEAKRNGKNTFRWENTVCQTPEIS
jgi:PleD family two-component response regulator